MSNKDVLQQASQLARGQVNNAAVESAERIRHRNARENRERYGCPDCGAAACYLTCPRYLTHVESEILWAWWASTNPSSEPSKSTMGLTGPLKKGGGSKSGKKRKKPPKLYQNPFTET